MSFYPRTHVSGAGFSAVNIANSIGYFLNGGGSRFAIIQQNQNEIKKCGEKWPIDFIASFSSFPAPIAVDIIHGKCINKASQRDGPPHEGVALMTKFEAGKIYSVWSIVDLAEIRVRIAERAGNVIITDDFRKMKISVVDGIERVTLWHVPFAPTMTAA